jgi:hypothetical protein
LQTQSAVGDSNILPIEECWFAIFRGASAFAVLLQPQQFELFKSNFSKRPGSDIRKLLISKIFV